PSPDDLGHGAASVRARVGPRPAPRDTVDEHERIPHARRDDLDTCPARPTTREEAELGDRLVRERHRLERDDLVAARARHPRAPLGVDPQPDPGAPAQSAALVVTRRRGDLALGPDATEASELLTLHRGPPRALGGLRAVRQLSPGHRTTRRAGTRARGPDARG